MFFYSLDNNIISCFQWMIRQIELYTEITRKEIIAFCLTMAKYSLILFFGFLALEWSQGQIIGFVNFINFLYYGVTYFEIKNSNEKNKPINILPVEITTRKLNRTMLLFIEMLALPSLFLLIWLISHDDESTMYYLEIYETIMFLLVVQFTFCLEYLICTISLPPGEKEKRRVEKEMKNLIPIPIR